MDEKRELVGAISDLGETDSDSPNSVKQYLIQNAPPVLLDVAKTGANPFLQGEAISALRGMGVSRAILEQAAAIAEADPNAFVQSRGEILRNYIQSMPAEDAASATRAVDPEKKKAGIAYLDKRSIAVSTESLRAAALRADPETVKALLDAGIAPDTGAADASQTPLYFALAQACHSQGAETDWLVETVRLLDRRRRGRRAPRRQQEPAADARRAVPRPEGGGAAGRRRRQGRRRATARGSRRSPWR